MNNKNNKCHVLATITLILSAVGGCTASQPMVAERLDAQTAVTVTHSTTPLILSPDGVVGNSNAREYVQIGVIEVNEMGTREHFLWLGIWDLDHLESTDTTPKAYETIQIVADDREMTFGVHGWTHGSIGVSTRSYKKIFAEDVDAYYRVSLDQLSALNNAADLMLRTTGYGAAKEFVPWYNQQKASADLAEFYRVVSQ